MITDAVIEGFKNIAEAIGRMFAPQVQIAYA